jgi:SAM-dependent methyltransferase
MQSYGWSLLFVLFALLCAATAWVSAKAAAGGDKAAGGGDKAVASSAQVPQAASHEEAGAPAPGWGQLTQWIILSAMGSCVLLAITNHLTQNIASIPFLWLVPLSLYLITFILCFDHPRWYVRPLFMGLAAIAIPLMAWYADSLNLHRAAPLYAVGLFICCMFCHGELYRLRPPPKHLTSFYLMISIGGALGALLIAIGAPLFLKGYFELSIVLAACALLLAWHALAMNRVAAALAFVMVLGTGVLVVGYAMDYSRGIRVMERNFYGVVRTRDFHDPVHFRVMYHGAINHGGQLMAPEHRRTPSTYFGPTSGYGRAFASLRELDHGKPRRVGVIGLGAGAIAAYARKGDHFRFYEIDPRVAAVAMTEFTFLSDARNQGTQIDVVLGDGRLSLEREKPQQYDLLAIDAFSGDSIPMHLLTRESMAIYLKHLAPGGVIVFQATNRFVDIAPVVARLADEAGFGAVMVSDDPENNSARGPDYWLSATDQILVSRNRDILNAPLAAKAGVLLKHDPKFPVWTDDFYNLFSVLKR